MSSWTLRASLTNYARGHFVGSTICVHSVYTSHLGWFPFEIPFIQYLCTKYYAVMSDNVFNTVLYTSVHLGDLYHITMKDI